MIEISIQDPARGMRDRKMVWKAFVWLEDAVRYAEFVFSDTFQDVPLSPMYEISDDREQGLESTMLKMSALLGGSDVGFVRVIGVPIVEIGELVHVKMEE